MEEITLHAFKKGHKNPALASFCVEHGWDEDDFKNALKQIKKYRKKYAVDDNQKPGGQIPDIRIDGKKFGKEGYRFYKLPDGDIRGLQLGEFTNCCQHLAGVGEDCAKHGFLSEAGGFYVVEEKESSDIVAQSWVWRGKKGELCFDSLESLPGHLDAQNWQNLAQAFAACAHKDKAANITAVHIGRGGATPSLPFNEAARLAKPFDYKGYRDSESAQYVVDIA